MLLAGGWGWCPMRVEPVAVVFGIRVRMAWRQMFKEEG